MACVLAVTIALACQGASAGEASADERAARVLDRAAEALGGWQRLASLPPFLVEGRGYEDLSAEHQGLAPRIETRRDHEERFAADPARAAVAYERRTPRNDLSLRWRRFGYVGGDRVVVDFDGRWARRSPSQTAERDLATYTRRFPHLLIAEVGARREGLRWVSRSLVEGAECDLVAWRVPTGEEVTLAFDARTALLRRVESRFHAPTFGDATAAFVFSGWREHPELVRVPAGHELRFGDRVLQRVAYTRVVTGAEAAAGFEVPEAFLAPRQPGPARARPPLEPGAVERVAEGVYYVELRGLGVMFVEMRDFVVAVEAPEVPRWLDVVPPGNASMTASVSEEFLETIRKTVPGKPVRYVVVTHHHSDHAGGVRAFLAAGATALVSAETGRLVEAMAAAPHTIRPDGFRTGARPSIEVVAGRRAITDGERTIEVVSVGRNPHTDENLFVYLPKERVVYQGDMFYFEDGTPFPPPSRVTMNTFFARWLAERKIEVDRVYGTHNDGYATAEHLAISRR